MDYKELLDIMKNRRSIRDFKNKKINRDDVMELLSGAITAPSGSNIQAWLFGVIDDHEQLEKIFLFSPGLIGNPQCIIIVCSDLKLAYNKGSKLGSEMAIIDVSMALENIILLAAAKGIGTCVVKSFNKNAIKKILELPDYVSPELIVTLGYAKNDFKSPPPKKELKDVIFFNNWR